MCVCVSEREREGDGEFVCTRAHALASTQISVEVVFTLFLTLSYRLRGPEVLGLALSLQKGKCLQS